MSKVDKERVDALQKDISNKKYLIHVYGKLLAEKYELLLAANKVVSDAVAELEALQARIANAPGNLLLTRKQLQDLEVALDHELHPKETIPGSSSRPKESKEEKLARLLREVTALQQELER